MSERKGHPKEIRDDIQAARRLEWWNIFWSSTVVLAMGLVMGSSQAMKTAWVEDMLALVPPVVFLLATRWEAKSSDPRFQYGFDRVNSLGFLVAAVALATVGLFLVKDAAMALIAQKHVTIGTARLWGRDIWLGWFMLAAQVYAIVPPVIIGHKELPLAKRLKDKLLHTDALMNKANWQTGVAGFVGVAGIGLGYWWTDSVAALLIAMSIIKDGWSAMKIATAELVDGIPHELGETALSKEAASLAKALKAEFPDAEKVLLRETGRFIRAEVVGARPGARWDPEMIDCGDCESWRIDSISFRP
jgi:divalent metal cation (Fe/Co/Zn/Cd) transporter